MRAREFKFNGLMVKMLRRQMGIGYRELAKRSGLTERQILLIESGRTRDPRLSTMCALSQALGIEVQQLIFKVPSTPKA